MRDGSLTGGFTAYASVILQLEIRRLVSQMPSLHGSVVIPTEPTFNCSTDLV